MSLKSLLAVTLVLLTLVGCTVPEQDEISSADLPSSNTIAAPEKPLAIPPEVVSSKETFSIAADDFPAGNYFGYLYVTDKEGAPISNLLFLSEDNWFVRQRDGTSKTNGISMNNGLLPFYLQQIDLSEQEHSYVIVNYDTEGVAYTLPLSWGQETFEKLLAGEILSVVWDQPTPAQTAKQVSQAVDIYLQTAEGKPVPNVLIRLEEPRMDGPRPETGVETPSVASVTYSDGIHDPRYTDQDGYVRISRKLLESRIKEDQDFCYRILVQDSILVPYELQMTEFIAPAYQEGELFNEFRLVLPEI